MENKNIKEPQKTDLEKQKAVPPAEDQKVDTLEQQPQESETLEPSESKPSAKEVSATPPREIVAEETGVISSNTKVIGDIGTEGHLAIYGEVEGNISARGDIIATGKIEGDITCSNLKMTGCQVKTNISVKEMVILDQNAKVEGKIQCKNISIDGNVKGDIDARGEVNIYKNAKISGSIRTKALGIESGAEIQGNVMVVK